MDEKEWPYYPLHIFLKEKFHKKMIKLSLNAGFTCPNRDGKLSTKGCLFCSEKGSGDFAGDSGDSIFLQIEKQKKLLLKKWPSAGYIAYFQAFTNTYAPIHVLREKYLEALSAEGVEALAIATRPDCLGKEVLELLEEIKNKTYLWVELGLQTSCEKTALMINRGYENKVFEKAVSNLHHMGIDVVAHVILGLPGETKKEMLETVAYLNRLPIQGVKFHLLHILRDTPLFSYYEKNPFPIFTREEYISLLCELLSHLRKDIVIHRLTGDGDKRNLAAPLWTLNKRGVLNGIFQYLKENKIRQGDFYREK